MGSLDVHFSTGDIEWETPPDLFTQLDDEFHFTLDPCATEQNHKCEKYFTMAENGLAQDWSDDVVFMNPPYGNPQNPCRQSCRKKVCQKRGYHLTEYVPGIEDWVMKAYQESQKGATVVCLVPARTETQWFYEYCFRGEVRFIKGRIQFMKEGTKKATSAPFPSAIVVFRPPQEETPCLTAL